ncbi:MAG: ribosome maturation protein SDO1 [Candidatus Woesearchaeota archaeon]|jgi:ribosome maturation protein SDO1
MAGVTFDPEKFQLTIARLKKGGNTYELVIEPDAAISFREGVDIPLEDIITSEDIFADAQKGMLAAAATFQSTFETTDVKKIALTILRDGDIHLTAEYRQKIRDKKRNQILTIIVQNGIDPRTKLPHPLVRIESAFEQAKCKVSEFKRAEDQVQDVLRDLQPILPISFQKKTYELTISAAHAAKAYGALQNLGDISKQDWKNDGSLQLRIAIPGGMVESLLSKINALTQGQAQLEEIKNE